MMRSKSHVLSEPSLFSTDGLRKHSILLTFLAMLPTSTRTDWTRADVVAAEMASSNTPAGHFKILYFAAASAYTAKNDEALVAPLDVTELFQALEELYPGIKAKILASCAVTVNLEYVDSDEKGVVIQAGDEVAIIPPVSGG